MKIEDLIGLYLTGQASEDQLKDLNKWIEESEVNAKTLRRMEEAWRVKPARKFYLNEDEVGDRVWNKLHKNHLHPKRLFRKETVYKVAAAFLVLLTSFFLVYRELQKQPPQKDILARSTIVKSNPSGVRSTIRLPDGSTVILNAESTIEYNFQSNDSIRLIELEGEAYFQVMKNEIKPFIVRSGDVVTQAIGTEFNIRAYPADRIVGVSLSEGKVKVTIPGANRKEKDFYLDPGSGVEVDRNSLTGRVKAFNYKEVMGWKDGVLFFRENSLDEVLSKLSRWYDVNFVLENYDGAEWNYTGEFEDEYLDVILKSMSYSEHFEYQITNGNVILNFDENK